MPEFNWVTKKACSNKHAFFCILWPYGTTNDVASGEFVLRFGKIIFPEIKSEMEKILNVLESEGALANFGGGN